MARCTVGDCGKRQTRGAVCPATGGALVLMAGVAMAAAALPSTRAEAQPPQFTPADFSFLNRLGELHVGLDGATSERHAILVECEGFVETDGSISDYNCMTAQPHTHGAFLRAVLEAVPTQTFLPAAVDGKLVRVFMSFSVLFNCIGKSCLAVPLRNHGHLFTEYGLVYSAPQPILAGEAWYSGFAAKLDWTRAGMPTIGDLLPRARRRFSDESDDAAQAPVAYTLTAIVGADGTAREPSVQGPTSAFPAGSRYTLKIARRSLSSFAAVKFVPGFYHDAPVEMSFQEHGIVFQKP